MHITTIRATPHLLTEPAGAHLTCTEEGVEVPDMILQWQGERIQIRRESFTPAPETRYISVCQRRGPLDHRVLQLIDPPHAIRQGYDIVFTLAYWTEDVGWTVQRVH